MTKRFANEADYRKFIAEYESLKAEKKKLMADIAPRVNAIDSTLSAMDLRIQRAIAESIFTDRVDIEGVYPEGDSGIYYIEYEDRYGNRDDTNVEASVLWGESPVDRKLREHREAEEKAQALKAEKNAAKEALLARATEVFTAEELKILTGKV
jgi:hypothetical protein